MAKIDSTPLSVTAGADLTSSQWLFGAIGSSGVVPCSTLGQRSHGIIGAPVTSGEATDLYIERRAKVLSSAAIAVGAALTPTATGTAVTATASSGQIVRAVALSAADGANELIDCLLIPAYAA